jgi:hypothetical protein
MDIDFIFLHRIEENDDIIGIDIINLIDILSEYPVHESLSYDHYII